LSKNWIGGVNYSRSEARPKLRSEAPQRRGLRRLGIAALPQAGQAPFLHDVLGYETLVFYRLLTIGNTRS
jgi:hypothetical protein